MRFRPCIDIHNGKIKQIVGGKHLKEDFRLVEESQMRMPRNLLKLEHLM